MKYVSCLGWTKDMGCPASNKTHEGCMAKGPEGWTGDFQLWAGLLQSETAAVFVAERAVVGRKKLAKFRKQALLHSSLARSKAQAGQNQRNHHTKCILICSKKYSNI